MPTCYNAQPPSFCQPVLLYVETGCARLEERVNALTLARAVALGSPLTLMIGAIALLRRKIDRYELTSTIDPSHFFPTVEPRPRHSQGKRGAVGPGDGAGGHLEGVSGWTRGLPGQQPTQPALVGVVELVRQQIDGGAAVGNPDEVTARTRLGDCAEWVFHQPGHDHGSHRRAEVILLRVRARRTVAVNGGGGQHQPGRGRARWWTRVRRSALGGPTCSRPAPGLGAAGRGRVRLSLPVSRGIAPAGMGRPVPRVETSGVALDPLVLVIVKAKREAGAGRARGGRGGEWSSGGTDGPAVDALLRTGLVHPT